MGTRSGLLGFFVLAAVGSSSGCYSWDRPCAGEQCAMDVGGPAGWQVMAQNVWDYYAAALPSDRAQLRPPFEAFHWIAVGDCPGDATQFVLPHVENCMAGNTTVWAGPSVSDIYIMDVGMKNGTLHHELLHAWLALSGVEGGDENHTRDEWKTLLPAAFNDVRQ